MLGDVSFGEGLAEVRFVEEAVRLIVTMVEKMVDYFQKDWQRYQVCGRPPSEVLNDIGGGAGPIPFRYFRGGKKKSRCVRSCLQRKLFRSTRTV